MFSSVPIEEFSRNKLSLKGEIKKMVSGGYPRQMSDLGHLIHKKVVPDVPVEEFNILEDKRIFPDFKRGGPLEEYRQKASFDWKKLKLILKNKDALKLQYDVWDFMEKNQLFVHPDPNTTLDEYRHLTVQRTLEFYKMGFYNLNSYLTDSDFEQVLTEAMICYDSSFFIKFLVAYGLFPLILAALGTSRLSHYIADCLDNKIFGAFALTEVGHGTNALQLQTTATFCPETDDFVINTADFEAAKCWAGNMGKTATHAIVFAQLLMPDGQNHGLNLFLVQIRDVNTLKTQPGVIVGDLGEKIGLNGLDNGFVMFDNYHIPRENLLSRFGDINKKGEFQPKFIDKNKKLAATFGALSGGRVGICSLAVCYLTKAITIGIRYSASRKQFGPTEDGPEVSVLEYQSQQYRLLPHLATTFAIRIFSTWLSKAHRVILAKSLTGDEIHNDDLEMHALSSAAKPVCSWAARDGIQECREACGGHGYLKCAQIGELRNDNDANCTYEGENNVLIQQASNWLLNIRKKGYQTFGKVSPLKTVDFLSDFDKIIKYRFVWTTLDEVSHPENLLLTLTWLLTYQLEKTGKRVEFLKSQGKSGFETRNDSQTFYATVLSILYGERTVFSIFYNKVKELNDSPNEQRILTNLLSLFGLNLMVKYTGLLYEGGFIVGDQSRLYQEAILKLLPGLAKESISLVDSIAPPDFILNSPLGMSDGDVYKHMESTIMSAPDALSRPIWFKDALLWEQQAKL